MEPTLPTDFSYDRKPVAKKDWGATLPEADKKQIHKSAKAFEAMYMSEMMNYMFTDTDMSDSSFGGGAGEDMYKSLMVNEYANKFSQSGQAALAPTLEREMLRLQELQKNPHNTQPTATDEVSHD